LVPTRVAIVTVPGITSAVPELTGEKHPTVVADIQDEQAQRSGAKYAVAEGSVPAKLSPLTVTIPSPETIELYGILKDKTGASIVKSAILVPTI
jgi:hypothetical protein